MTLVIRRAVDGDETTLTRLNQVVHDLHVAQRPDFFKATQAGEVSRRFKELLAHPTIHIWLAEEDGAPIGYVLAMVQERGESPITLARRWLEIDEIAVDPSQRQKGVARALVQAVIAEAKSQGIGEVGANTWGFNQVAQSMFQNLGFAVKTVRFELSLPGDDTQ